MEYWDIYDEKKQKTGRTMKRNDWNMKPDEYHLTVLGVLKRPDGRYLITQRKLDKEWGWITSFLGRKREEKSDRFISGRYTEMCE